MKKDIKILATVGPASLKEHVIKGMDSAGIDVFRINLSHTKIEDLEDVIKKIRQWTKKPICLDTEGAQIRTGTMKGGKVEIKSNNVVLLVDSNVIGDEAKIPLYPIDPKKYLKIGDVLTIDFNQVMIQVIKNNETGVLARVLVGGVIGSNKGVHIDQKNNLLAFTDKDFKAFKLAQKMGISFFSLSFASKKEDVQELRSYFKYPIVVISKIESKHGITNLKEICKQSDGILIDRGDLSREVPLEKIGLAQIHIINNAKKWNTPVYVATNLLESMLDNFQPTRAEVNDITNTLLTGAHGLVLAAETAIGRHPIECARMASDILEGVEKYKKEKDSHYLNSIYEYNLIEPHGGVLVQNIIDEKEVKNIEKLEKLKISDKTLLDVMQIAEGVYSPISGFMNYKELVSVLDNYKMPNGVAWTLPILLQSNKGKINFKRGKTIALQGEKDKIIYAIMKVSEIRKIDLDLIAEKWFGTNDLEHPGVESFKKRGEYIIAGLVYLIRKPASYTEFYSLTPKQTREIFKNLGWKKIVGFHTRNVIHRGHEYVQMEALKKVKADALFVSPVIGPKKKNDFTAKAIVQGYEIMIKNKYYDPYPAFIGSFTTYSRYSGPREAVFTALCRKNFGCSHFVIGRDHTGVGNYYSPNASQEIFKKIGDIGIKPVMFDEAYFCKKCNKVTSNCKHKEITKISGTKARTCLLEGEKIPNYLMRKEIILMLEKLYKDPKEKLFEDGK